MNLAQKLFPKWQGANIWPLYALGAYVTLQFGWWAYMLVDLNGQIYQLKLEHLILSDLPAPDQLIEKAALDQKLRLRLWMVLGEGAVFMTILALGFRAVRNAVKKELDLGRRQRNFLLSVTHELRSPLAAIRLNLQTIEKRDPEAKLRQKLCSTAIVEADRLNRLIDNVLLSAKMEAGKIPLMPEIMDVSVETERILTALFSAEIEKGHVKYSLEPGHNASGDPDALKSIISNLVANALKYGGQPSEVKISVHGKASQVLIEVADNGPGIAEADRANVFDMFYRVGNEDTRKAKGTGLGLYIARRLALASGGSLTVGQNQPRGAIFTLSLPKIDGK